MTDAGLGLDNEKLLLVPTPQAWIDAGAALRAHVAELLRSCSTAAAVEQIGSSSVVGLLAKPIVDLAVGLAADQPVDVVRSTLERDGWICRGDAGDDGGRVLVLEDRPWHRVAHVHVVVLDGQQWRDYLRLRDLLRDDASAREQCAAATLRLHERYGDDRSAYTEGKSDVVRRLLSGT